MKVQAIWAIRDKPYSLTSQNKQKQKSTENEDFKKILEKLMSK